MKPVKKSVSRRNTMEKALRRKVRNYSPTARKISVALHNIAEDVPLSSRKVSTSSGKDAVFSENG